MPPTMEAESLNHWATREVLDLLKSFFFCIIVSATESTPLFPMLYFLLDIGHKLQCRYHPFKYIIRKTATVLPSSTRMVCPASDEAYLSASSRFSTGDPSRSLSRLRSGMPTQKWSLPTVIRKLCSKEESDRRPGERLYKSKR